MSEKFRQVRETANPESDDFDPKESNEQFNEQLKEMVYDQSVNRVE